MSSIDTAILLCGVLTCREHFSSQPKCRRLAHQMFNRVDWNWLSEDTPILPHGWRPETGFLQFRWENYSEMMMMYLLGLGSTSIRCRPRPGTPGSGTNFEYQGIRYIGSFAPLFIHQYSQAWFDFRGKRDRYADYFQNPSSPPTSTAASASTCAASFPTTATTCGESRRPIRRRATRCGAVRRRPGRSTAPWCPPLRRVAAVHAAGGDARAAHDQGSLSARRGAGTASSTPSIR